MKPISHLVLLSLLSLTISLPAQITITAEDVPNIGDMLEYLSDTMPTGLTPGPAGENQTWNFTQLTGRDTFSSTFVDPGEGPNSGLFPNANIAIKSDSIYIYALLTQEGFFNLGTAIDIPVSDDPILVRFDPPQAAFRFPLSFGTTYEDTYTFSITLSADSIDLGSPAEFDSLRIRHTEVAQVNVDAYGQITTDFNTFDVLRMHTVSTAFDTIEIQISGFWTPINTLETMSEEYSWVGENGLGPVFSLSLDENGSLTDAQWLSGRQTGSGGVMAPVAQFSFNNQGDGTIDFTDQSTNTPTSWLWDFDDGSTSDEPNPTHTFSTSGSYNVCLTVQNSAGQNTSCQTIEIMLTSTETLRSTYGFELYPNPAGDQVRIKLERPPSGQDLFLSVRSLLGQDMFSGKINSQIDLSTTHWPAGNYPYFVSSATGEVIGSGWLQINR